MVWAKLGRMPDPLTEVPTIAVEMVSRGRRNRRRDYVEKRAEYAAAGVKEYWIVDRFERMMTVCYVDGSERVVTEAETYATPLLPGFGLPLADLLAAADRWEPRGRRAAGAWRSQRNRPAGVNRRVGDDSRE